MINPRTVSQAYQELEREGVVYVRRGQGTFVSANARTSEEERRALARSVAKRALLDARRNGLGLEDLMRSMREVAAEEDGEGAARFVVESVVVNAASGSGDDV